MPAIVIASEPATWPPTAIDPHSHSLRSSSVTTSAENVENVVRPPRKPVVVSRRISGGNTAWLVKSSIAKPMSNPPIRFAASVPRGTVGKSGLSAMPSPQRSHAPTAAPPPTANKPLHDMQIPLSRLTRDRCYGRGDDRGYPRGNAYRLTANGCNQSASSALRRFTVYAKLLRDPSALLRPRSA